MKPQPERQLILMLISEIFESIDGESKRAGELSIFIRSVGCNLRCKFCDSRYTWKAEQSSKNMSVDEIIDYIKRFDCKNITFTGGEPLIQKDSDELIIKLANLGYDVSIETDGAVDFTNREWFGMKNVWICADYKCYASGMTDKMLPLDKFAKLSKNDVIKFVVGSERDLILAKNVIKDLREKSCECYFYLSPVFGEIELDEIVTFMMKNNLSHKIRFQVQLHKIVWNPTMRGV